MNTVDPKAVSRIGGWNEFTPRSGNGTMCVKYEITSTASQSGDPHTTWTKLGQIASQSKHAEPTYSDIGAMLTGRLPAGFRADRYERELTARPEQFERAVQGLRTSAAHIGAGLMVEPDHPPAEGSTVAVAAPLGAVSFIAVCRVVVVVDEPNRYGFVYGTLPGHPERGEEAFVLERTSGRVVFRIVAFSKPAELLPRFGGPITRRVQQRTTRRYLDGLEEFAARDR